MRKIFLPDRVNLFEIKKNKTKRANKSFITGKETEIISVHCRISVTSVHLAPLKILVIWSWLGWTLIKSRDPQNHSSAPELLNAYPEVLYGFQNYGPIIKPLFPNLDMSINSSEAQRV